MLPQISTLKQVKFVIGHYQQWRGAERIKALEKCKQQLENLVGTGRVSIVVARPIRAKLLPLLSEERSRWNRRQRQSAKAMTDMKPSTPSGARTAKRTSSTDKEPSVEQSTKSLIAKRKSRRSTKSPAKGQPSSTKKVTRRKSSKRVGTPSTAVVSDSPSQEDVTES